MAHVPSLLTAENARFQDPDYSDEEIESLMRYFQVSTYFELTRVLYFLKIRR